MFTANWVRKLFATAKSNTVRKARPLAVEQLEDRALMTTASLTSGILRVEGTSGADEITFRQVQGIIRIDGLAGSYSASQVSKILVTAGAGDDVISVDSEYFSGHQPITAQTFVYGGAGKDKIYASQGYNMLFGEGDNDEIWGNINDDLLDGGAGSDDLMGDAGNDDLYGDLGDDQLWGQGGDDYLVGGDGADYLDGDTGFDKLDGGRQTDELWGGANNDTLQDDLGTIFADVAAGDTKLSGHFGWFDANLTNAAVRSYARATWFDREVSREDVLDLCNEVVKTDNLVSSTELSDLRKLGNSGTNIGMPAHVRNLLGKVANSNTANAKYKGATLGNLFNGATSTHLSKLINKWFLGLDRPDNTQPKGSSGTIYSYKKANGNLFDASGSPKLNDIRQGDLGDCYFLAAIGATAHRKSSVVSAMFIDNGDDTWTVRYFKSGVADYVTVDRFLPATSTGTLAFADVINVSGSAGNVNGTSNVLWVALAEKAYAQMNAGGGLGQAASTNSYLGIDGGFGKDALRHVNGTTATGSPTFSFTTMNTDWNAGKLLVFATKSSGVASNIVSGHEYVVQSINKPTSGTATSSNTTFTLYNPHGNPKGTTAGKPITVTLTLSQIQASFVEYQVGN